MKKNRKKDTSAHRKMMYDYIKETGKPCSVAQFSVLTEETSLYTSRFLDNQVMLGQDETLPQNEQGTYLFPILQINLEEVPFVPKELEGKAWVTIYLDFEYMLISSLKEGNGWVMRTYDSLSELKSITFPKEHLPSKSERWIPCKVRWTLEQDYLDDRSSIYEVLPPRWQNIEEALPYIFRNYRPNKWFDYDKQNWTELKLRFKGEGGSWNIDTTKLGGYPTLHQSDYYKDYPSHPQNFIFQILRLSAFDIENYTGSTSKKGFDLSDCSSTYFGIIDDEWYMETQTS